MAVAEMTTTNRGSSHRSPIPATPRNTSRVVGTISRKLARAFKGLETTLSPAVRYLILRHRVSPRALAIFGTRIRNEN
jgi:hypothetical protein